MPDRPGTDKVGTPDELGGVGFVALGQNRQVIIGSMKLKAGGINGDLFTGMEVLSMSALAAESSEH